MRGDTQPTEARILEIASRLFFERGYHATTMRDLAAEVGIKASSLYNHFPGKQDILVRICLSGVHEFHEGALEKLKDVSDIRERIRALIVWHVSFDTRSRYKARVADTQLDALNAEARKEVIGMRDAYDKLLQDELRRGEKQGLWKLENPGITRLGIAGMCNAVTFWYREDGSLKPEEIGELYATFVLNALSGYAIE
jgi:AcrR family transcriptional regulator